MNFSRIDFNQNAKNLLSALTTVSNSNGHETTRYDKLRSESLRSFDLCHWEIHYDNNRNDLLHLSHPHVIFFSNCLVEDIFLATEDSDDDLLENEAIMGDDQCFVAMQKEENKNEKDDPQKQLATQWTFSIIYSSTFRVPVLYFIVQDMNGIPVGRQQLLEILRQEHKGDFPTDTWEFVSQEENPITGLISYFLHPCEAAQRLQLLTAGTRDQKEVQNLTNNGSTNNIILWTWMSMILPVVGHSIPAFYFLKIQNQMAQLETRGTTD